MYYFFDYGFITFESKTSIVDLANTQLKLIKHLKYSKTLHEIPHSLLFKIKSNPTKVIPSSKMSLW